VAADNTVDIGALQYRPAPNVTGKAYITPKDTILTATAANGVRLGASDPDGLDLAATQVTAPAYGSLDLKTDGSFTYTPTAGFIGADSFEFRLSNYQGRSDTATANITISECSGPGSAGWSWCMLVQAAGLGLVRHKCAMNGGRCNRSGWAGVLPQTAHGRQPSKSTSRAPVLPLKVPPRPSLPPGPRDTPSPGPANEPPQAQGSGGPFTTPKNQVLFIPPGALAALFRDPEGAAVSVALAGQPEAGKGTAAAMEGGGIAFKPRFKASDPSEFLVAAKDPAGASSASLAVKVTMLGGWGPSSRRVYVGGRG
jgi:hypothetical protein